MADGCFMMEEWRGICMVICIYMVVDIYMVIGIYMAEDF